MIPDMVGTGFTGLDWMNIEYGDTVLVLGIGPVELMDVAAAALNWDKTLAYHSRIMQLKIYKREFGMSGLLLFLMLLLSIFTWNATVAFDGNEGKILKTKGT